MTDYIDALTHSAEEIAGEAMLRNAIGVPIVRAMAVPGPCPSSEVMDKWAADYEATCMNHLPIPFWSDNGTLEPLTTGDLEQLKATGITPEEWEICILEDHLEQRLKMGVRNV